MDNLQFKEIRKDILKITQKDLSLMLGLSSNSIARMERGEMQIEKRTVLALKWIVYESNGITFKVRERANEESERREDLTTENIKEIILTWHTNLTGSNLTDAIERVALVKEEFKLSVSDIRVLIKYSQPSDLINIRKLRGCVRDIQF